MTNPIRPGLHSRRSERSTRQQLQMPQAIASHVWHRSSSTPSLLHMQRHHHSDPHSSSINKSLPASRNSIEQDTNGGDLGQKTLSKQDDDNVVVDVLPSFEMYNVLHRHIPQGNVDPDRHDFPPNYTEIQNQQGPYSGNNSSFVVETSADTDRASDGTNSNSNDVLSPFASNRLNSLNPMSTQHLSIQNTTFVDADGIDIEDDLGANENIVIDKLYTLPKTPTALDITIRLTKRASLPPEEPEEESILKEYVSGDVIHGYCIVENKSDEPLKFEMFYVTLEGYISIIDKEKGKRTAKRFLRMVDISASWSYSTVDLGSGVKYIPGEVDFDGSILGLGNSRSLEPGVKHKKFFMFKLPGQLLDVTCKHEHFQHCLLPPSFGIDKYKDHWKYSEIKVNPVLGCGNLGTKGSPVLTYDMSSSSLSVNYTIDAKIVGKDKKTKKLNIMKEKEYNIRVIPFGFHSELSAGERASLNQLNDLKTLIEERISALKKIFERLEKNELIQNIDIHGTDISGTMTEEIELNSEEILRRKMDQLHMNNRFTSEFQEMRDYKKGMPLGRHIESELSYKIRSKNSLKKNLFSGFLAGASSSSSSPETENSDKMGIILVSTKVPETSLHYSSPSLVRKTNKFEARTKRAQENWKNLLETISDEERKGLTKLPISLVCVQSNNSAIHEPPEIQAITTELLCITARAENSIPIKLDSALLLNEEEMQEIKKKFNDYLETIQRYNEKFEENYEKLNELYNQNSSTARELKFTDFIPSQLINDMDSIVNLKVKVDSLQDVFKRQLDTLKDDDSISPVSSSASPGETILSPRGSIKMNAKGALSSTAGISKSSVFSKYVDQIIHEWVKQAPMKYQRKIDVNLEYNNSVIKTIIPSFESCLCCRQYSVRVHIKFHNAGSTYIDVPVTVKNF
ncbi:hypothetical protein KAFR_0B03880 [Kazachstania africana CBS 2517]|uniref:Bul1 N-terminal domain-containing protein n=1 Tax=Kazachstania africana (strain ATCC 22294 / BCRC 22015 / CBS 2517 / CECT 1963 / NBRC 1671 / NRRL Y-8276) TaxID=1071382 RepID=H2AQN4_KAZAF|nr:hypothetical protein KAFR_0B03880 [Kazachstania africana CBS 2517]CCF56684.1 hypothetical protein KAFR_0B03880 [Kazachstania africana CBS 2517]